MAILDTAVCIHCNKQIFLEEEIFVVVGEARDLAGGVPRYAHADCCDTQVLMPATGPRWDTAERPT